MVGQRHREELLLVVENLVMIKTEMIKVGKALLEHCPPL